MKFYICAIRPYKNSLNPSDFVSSLINLIPSITTQAKEELGEDVITVIATYEYAIGGKKGITKQEKTNYLAKLQEAVKTVPNLLVIPGTIATLTDISSNDIERITKKEQKLAIKYDETRRKYEAFEFPTEEGCFYKERYKFLKNQNQPGDKKYLGNIAHAFVGNKEIKHKKNRPIFETRLHPERIYNLGREEYFYDVNLAGNNMEMGILICAEQNDNDLRKLMEERAPFLEVVLSNGTGFIPDNMFGALNLHVDVDTSCSGCCIGKAHRLARNIETVEVHNLFVSTKDAVIDDHQFPASIWTTVASMEPEIIVYDEKKPGIVNPDFREDIDNILARITDKPLFLINNPGLVKDGEDILMALKYLEPQEQLLFVLEHIKKIPPAKIGKIIQSFHGNDLKKLIDSYIAENCKNSVIIKPIVMMNIAKALQPSDCFQFALKYQQHLPKQTKWLLTILKRMDPNDRFELLKQSRYEINDTDSLIQIGKEIPQHARLSMLLDHKDLVEKDISSFKILLDEDQLGELISGLDDTIRSGFVSGYR
ncbi:hypothetical protein Lqui_2001 [Legionella quinlivanii]|uniref:Uncharacterized protein n=2 Tax=Legionella quinlivanii TaxID=45073 RepID=A0A0W0XUU5_9GAMM|nr:hypothetical protein [Legionella quinlivanii]KTD48190.1 hypothetical protein Lqui_2001 [Legionella quinlivanii]SEF99384.1 hypothetical protein SAMN02746093_01614 [Legionella quinlivanii DSM 21216]STY11361.1 Uncharacterised protein [Legionella quinlivanii]